MSVSELYRYTVSSEEDLFPTFQHLNRFYDIANWQDKFLDIYAFVLEGEKMTIKRICRFNPLNYAELKDTLNHLERQYDLAKMEDCVLEVYVFVKDGINEETHLRFDNEVQEV